MALVPEIGFAQLAKTREELCGDAIEVSRTSESTVIVLSDGLGSGVKANILATLTTKIAAKMMRANIPVAEVVETIIATLPTCKDRGLAYSTFTIIKLNEDGLVQLFEYDAPSVLKISEGEIIPIKTINKKVHGKIIGEANFSLAQGEMLIVVSDGVTQAGLGGILPLGLGIEGLVWNLKQNVNLKENTQQIANQIVEISHAYYGGEMGDDTTALVVRMCPSREAVVLTGPPNNGNKDAFVVQKFMESKGKKIVSGGTTANIVARELGQELYVECNYVDPEVPPIAQIKGIDLVTEGILTLTKGLEFLEKNCIPKNNSLDGSSLLVKELLECDTILFMVGTKINPAHQNPELSLPLGLRKSIIGRWQKQLEARGKIVKIEWF